MSSTAHHPAFTRIYACISASAEAKLAMRNASFDITSIRRFHFSPELVTNQAAPKILGTARLPG